MTFTIRIVTTTLKTLSLFCVISAAVACSSNEKSSTPTTADATTQAAATTDKKMVASITITGIVNTITNGKDGYTADVKTDNDGTYAALVSISNLGGPDNYKRCTVGEQVTFKGIPSLTTSANGSKSLMVEQIIGIDPITTQFSIGAKGFKDVMVGDAIAKHKATVKKFTLKDGEGSFEAYKITDAEDNPAGYFTPDAKNKLLVGDITIETPKASTDKGIKVGSTFQELLKAYPNVEVHGSEIEGRTYAKAGGFSYRLDVPNFTYEVDKSKIKATAKITQIVIGR